MFDSFELKKIKTSEKIIQLKCENYLKLYLFKGNVKSYCIQEIEWYQDMKTNKILNNMTKKMTLHVPTVWFDITVEVEADGEYELYYLDMTSKQQARGMFYANYLLSEKKEINVDEPIFGLILQGEDIQNTKIKVDGNELFSITYPPYFSNIITYQNNLEYVDDTYYVPINPWMNLSTSVVFNLKEYLSFDEHISGIEKVMRANRVCAAHGGKIEIMSNLPIRIIVIYLSKFYLDL